MPSEDAPAPGCCPLYHEAVELIGRRWTGAILAVLLQAGPLRFGQISQAVPPLSDRMLAERLRELEARGVITREVVAGTSPRVTYKLTAMGTELQPALAALQTWAQHWLDGEQARIASRSN